MAQSKALKRLVQNITIDKYEDREEVLEVAKKEGFNSRQGTYVALAYAYQWYAMSIDAPSYMMQKFKSAEIKISDADKRNLFIPTIKLVFDFKEPQYYSRASEYALVLQYVHRMMDDDLYADSSDDPSIVITIIKDGEGIRKCADKQRAYNNPQNENEPSPTEISNYLQEACTKIYKGKKSSNKIKLDIPESPTDFVLMVGRPDGSGEIDVVDIMGIGVNEIYNLTKNRALNDTSHLSPALNMIGDTLGYLTVFGPKDKPVVTVEAGGELIRIGLDNNDETGVVISAKPKDPSALQGFDNRAHLSMKDKAWFLEKAQDRVHRRIYDIDYNASIKSSVSAFDMKNQIKDGAVKTIHFNSMTADTSGQVIRRDIDDSEWIFKAGFGTTDIDEIYVWMHGWMTVKRSSPSDRIVPIHVDDENITFVGCGGSKDLVIPATTGLAKGSMKKYRVFGRELAKVMEQIHLNPDIEGFYIRCPEGGLVEFIAEDTLLEYCIDLPTVLKGDVNHNTERFTNM